MKEKKTEKDFGSFGSIPISTYLSEYAHEIAAQSSGLDKALRVLSEAFGDHQMKWDKLWRRLHEEYDLPKESDGYRMWIDFRENTVVYKKRDF